ncbi:MAG: primosomal protein N' [Clostridiales bacterium]|jgi:primosomal protein N' (replication factor Y)|nr:primosomal protein N' [Clostridiales bacterium]
MKKFAKVIIASTAKDLDKPFYYAVPEDLRGELSRGRRVLVPFGKSRQMEGYIVDFADAVSFDEAKVKPIGDVLDDFPIFSPVMLDLADWMAQKYSATLAACFKTIMPAGISMKNDYVAEVAENAEAKGLKGRQKQIFEYTAKHGPVSERELKENFGGTTWANLQLLVEMNLITIRHIYDVKSYVMRINTAFLNDDAPDFDVEAEKVLEKGDKQAAVLEMLMEAKSLSVADIQLRLGISPSPIMSLEKKGLLRLEKLETRRNVTPDAPLRQLPDYELTKEQQTAIADIRAAFNEQNPRPVLIQGVTGSGKTEIYMSVIEDVLAAGKQAIMLVPEISLTPQAVDAFISRFGGKVTSTHSRMSLGERFDQWKRARDGQISVIIGPRSAIFTPFANLGAIIIDEEHESTYKSETTPKYETGAVALKLAELTGCAVIFGSATPNVGRFYQASGGHMGLITLKNRVNNRVAAIEVADMRKELVQGNKSIFSAALYAAIGQNLANRQQSILFLNRRGHSTFVSCRTCGHVMGCTNCNVNYTYHRYNHRLLCHYCGQTAKMPKNCPVCGSIYIKHFGVGTQKIEEYLAQEFPAARVLRMDLDTTTGKNSHLRIIRAFADRQADILVGTQMIAKGHNFPGVSLVGIVAADMALNNGDYRAAETTYQLITQVSGRAGRGDDAGRVIIQTYNPEHYSVNYAKAGDYAAFYAHEIEIRRQMNYPPFSHIYMLLFTGTQERRIVQTLHRLADIMRRANRKGLCEVLGPAPAIISKIRQSYRWKILVKCQDEDIIKKFVHYCLDKLREHEDLEGISINLTLDPAYIV